MGVWRTKNGGHYYIENGDDAQEQTLNDALMEKYAYTDLPTIRVSKKEYAVISSSIHFGYHNRYKGRKLINVYTSNYCYFVELYGFDSFRIIGKEELK